jgi:hypothetical protein
MKAVFITWVAMVVLPASCRQSEQEPDGGFCSYKDTEIPARVVDIIPVSPGQYDINLKLDSNEFRMPPNDTVSFYMENGHYLDKAVFDSMRVDTGNVYTFLVREIVQGSCNPFLTQVVMKKVN